jgi:hypothetical protein
VSIVGKSYPEPSQAIEFFEKVLLSRQRLGSEASICIDMDIVSAKLKLGLNSEAKQLLEEAKEKLSTINSSETVVFSKFYGVTAEYRKVRGINYAFLLNYSIRIVTKCVSFNNLKALKVILTNLYGR